MGVAGKPSEVVVDRQALFQSLYEHQQPDVLAYFLRRLGREDAVEATADAFLTAWRRIDDAPDGEEVRLWLFCIARNVLRNRQRTNRRIRRLTSRSIPNRCPRHWCCAEPKTVRYSRPWTDHDHPTVR
jgi:DNA-directed RNA polymerase specialized sigma24 family protein